MSRTVVNVLIGIAVAFVVAWGLSLLPALLGAPEVDLGRTPKLLAMVAGLVTMTVLNGLSGNRKVAPAGEAARRQALTFEASPTHAALYLVRTGFAGKAAGMNLNVDGREVAQLKSPRFTRVEIAPGPHVIQASFGGAMASSGKPAHLDLEVKAGDIAVVHVSVAMGLLGSKVKIERLQPEAIRDKLARIPMSAPDVAVVGAVG